MLWNQNCYETEKWKLLNDGGIRCAPAQHATKLLGFESGWGLKSTERIKLVECPSWLREQQDSPR